MKTLHDWLVGRGQRANRPSAAAVEIFGEGNYPAAEELVDPATEAYTRGRAEAFLEAEAVRKKAVENVEQECRARLEALDRSLGGEVCDSLADSIAVAFRTTRIAIEEALTAVLSEFLSETVRRRATAALLELIEQEIMRGAESLIEIRVPHLLQSRVRERLTEAKLDIPVADADRAEVICREGTVVFGSRLECWSQVLREASGDI